MENAYFAVLLINVGQNLAVKCSSVRGERERKSEKVREPRERERERERESIG